MKLSSAGDFAGGAQNPFQPPCQKFKAPDMMIRPPAFPEGILTECWDRVAGVLCPAPPAALARVISPVLGAN